MHEAARLLSDFILPAAAPIAGASAKAPSVLQLCSPTELHARFDTAGVPLPLTPDQTPLAPTDLLRAVSATLALSVRTSDPLFLNQLTARPDPVAVVGDWVAAAAHTPVHTYEVAPVFTEVERVVLRAMGRLIGGEYAQERARRQRDCGDRDVDDREEEEEEKEKHPTYDDDDDDDDDETVDVVTGGPSVPTSTAPSTDGEMEPPSSPTSPSSSPPPGPDPIGVSPVYSPSDPASHPRRAAASRPPSRPPRPGTIGLFVPGGSIANMYGLLLALYARYPTWREDGLAGLPPLAIFCSEQAHFSLRKAAVVLGLGRRAIIPVACDANGRMCSKALRRAVATTTGAGGESGMSAAATATTTATPSHRPPPRVPLAVVATAGTTVLGAFDSLVDAGAIAKEYGMWFHVDASWGGSVLFSPRHRQHVRGIETADSIAWSPHKMLGAPLQCSAVLTRHPERLLACNETQAEYLFQPDKLHAEQDLGDLSVQCSRRADAFKFWLLWKARGEAGLGRRVERAMELAQYFERRLVSHPSKAFRLVARPRGGLNVCFWVLPEGRLREETTWTSSLMAAEKGQEGQEDLIWNRKEAGEVVPLVGDGSQETRGRWGSGLGSGSRSGSPSASVDRSCSTSTITGGSVWPCVRGLGPPDLDLLVKTAPRVKRRLQREGQMLLGYQPLGDLPPFFRLVLPAPDNVTTGDLDHVLDLLLAAVDGDDAS